MQAPCQERSLAHTMIVRQPAAVEGGHKTYVDTRRGDSQVRQPGRLPIGRRLTTCPTSEFGLLGLFHNTEVGLHRLPAAGIFHLRFVVRYGGGGGYIPRPLS